MVTTAKNEHKCLISAVVGEWSMGYRGGSQRKPTTAEIERSCSVSAVVGGSMGCCCCGSQRKPTTAEIEHERSISVVVGGGLDKRWSQPPKTSTNARFQRL